MGTEKEFPAERVIIRQGDPDKHVYLLLSGLVKVTTLDADQETFLAIRVGGDVIGEMAAFEHRPRVASVETAVDTWVRVIQPAELQAFIERCPDGAMELMRMMSERLRWSNSRRVDIATRNATARVSRILLEVARIYGTKIPEGWDLGVPLTQAEIASLAGVGRRTAEKVLHELSQRGLVATGYRRLVITNVRGLQAEAVMLPEITSQIPH